MIEVLNKTIYLDLQLSSLHLLRKLVQWPGAVRNCTLSAHRSNRGNDSASHLEASYRDRKNNNCGPVSCMR